MGGRDVNKLSGFTLIELLVVIAIIGLLAAVVLAAVNTARSKGGDAAAKSNLDNIRTQSALFADSNSGNYYIGASAPAAAGPSNAACTGVGAAMMFVADKNVAKQIAAADSAEGGSKVVCGWSGSGAWVVYIPTVNNSGSNTGWCVDSTGISKADTAPAASTYKCP